MWSTIIELEFVHLMGKPGEPVSGCYLPSAATPNGFLVWVCTGEVVHGAYSVDRKTFTRSADRQELKLDDVRAWASLPAAAPKA